METQIDRILFQLAPVRPVQLIAKIWWWEMYQ